MPFPEESAQGCWDTYDYDILAGVFFAAIYGYHLWQSLKSRSWQELVCAAFLAAILGFGMFEMAVVSGQITVSLMGILFYMIPGELGISRAGLAGGTV